MGRVS